MPGLRYDEGAVLSYDREGHGVCQDASAGNPYCMSLPLLLLEPLCEGKMGERNELSDVRSDCDAGYLLCMADVSFFPGQGSLCVYAGECVCKNFALL